MCNDLSVRHETRLPSEDTAGLANRSGALIVAVRFPVARSHMPMPCPWSNEAAAMRGWFAALLSAASRPTVKRRVSRPVFQSQARAVLSPPLSDHNVDTSAEKPSPEMTARCPCCLPISTPVATSSNRGTISSQYLVVAKVLPSAENASGGRNAPAIFGWRSFFQVFASHIWMPSCRVAAKRDPSADAATDQISFSCSTRTRSSLPDGMSSTRNWPDLPLKQDVTNFFPP